MPTIEYQPETKPVEIDDRFFRNLIDPDRLIDSKNARSSWSKCAASIAARLVADAFFAAVDYLHLEYLEAFRTELRGFLRESDCWQDWVRIGDEIAAKKTWIGGPRDVLKCPACGKPKSELHADGCILRKRLLCDMDDVGCRPATDHGQSSSYAGKDGAE